jgi:serine/threonine protein phosphatase 1
MTSQIVRFSPNRVGRDFAVGDIHGAFGALKVSLDAIKFDYARDRLFSVGDLVDRGPQSKEVLNWLDKSWFNAICGNHDFMTWRVASGDPFGAVDHREHGGEWFYELPRSEQQEIGTRLANLPMIFEVETSKGLVGIVHADFPFDDWRDLNSIEWSDLEDMQSAAGHCIWSFERYDGRYHGMIRNIRAVVHGHAVIPIMKKLGNVYFIDTGGWHSEGAFTFLNLETLTPILGPKLGTSQPKADFPR